MVRMPVNSSNIKAIGHAFGTLEVEFTNGSIYQYNKVPSEVYYALLNAESKGKFLNSNIKGKYEYSLVAGATAGAA